ncbi:DUF4168 domain-containing protein [Pelagibius sp.]|uniref:DUF4168 domain-containing protein n=1 Tax=Pelagibius sp. TaxID=1931238 RepID=UPI00262ADA28|nr:DUF4168 domain-containing protein [Pelagibius sp.]
MPRPFPLLALALVVMAGLLPGPALAGGPATGLHLAQAAAPEVSQTDLEAYVAAVVKIQEIDAALQPRIDDADNADEAAALTREATDRMIAEVEAQGLTVEQYNSITRAAEQDVRLYERILTLLAARR